MGTRKILTVSDSKSHGMSSAGDFEFTFTMSGTLPESCPCYIEQVSLSLTYKDGLVYGLECNPSSFGNYVITYRKEGATLTFSTKVTGNFPVQSERPTVTITAKVNVYALL